ncbi:MAG: hypothetical protein V2B19_01210 [Pseudomonadota bacterium]
MAQNHKSSITAEDISKILEPLIRRVVREELGRITQKHPDIFYLEPGMPLYNDMKNLKKRKAQGKIELFSDEEVWGE